MNFSGIDGERSTFVDVVIQPAIAHAVTKILKQEIKTSELAKGREGLTASLARSLKINKNASSVI